MTIEYFETGLKINQGSTVGLAEYHQKSRRKIYSQLMIYSLNQLYSYVFYNGKDNLYENYIF